MIPISSSNHMFDHMFVCLFVLGFNVFDHMLESSHRDDSDKRSNIENSEEITQKESSESFYFTYLWRCIDDLS